MLNYLWANSYGGFFSMKKSLSNFRTPTVKSIDPTTVALCVYVGLPEGHKTFTSNEESYKGRLRQCDVVPTPKAEAPVMYYEKGYKKGELRPCDVAPTAKAEDDEQSIPESFPKWWEDPGKRYDRFMPRTARYKSYYNNTEKEDREKKRKGKCEGQKHRKKIVGNQRRKLIDNYYETLIEEALNEFYFGSTEAPQVCPVRDEIWKTKSGYESVIAEEDREIVSKKDFKKMTKMTLADWGFEEE
jgi:hypothetical protein